ncbi:MAG: nucleoside triphosphate pyrophosphohydrolase [Chromatiales bacterium]|jgi:ATP diphosphatase|nr:nucleoside triphosphate pyrophosphohydrolase [Chromatiales bacterium]
MNNIEKLLEVMQKLRDPKNGCPWDIEQDFSTIAPYTIEEAYEVADAIHREDFDELRAELGDLLFQIVFYAQMAAERGHFDFDDVAGDISAKMVRRHPHVFGSDDERAKGKVDGSWEEIKAQERAIHDDDSALAGIAKALPALMRAQKLGKRASRVGFDWPNRKGVHLKIEEELEELEEAVGTRDAASIEDEIGDLLFAVVNLARHVGVDAETALTGANHKFERRFRSMEAAIESEDLDLRKETLESLELRWRKAKKKVG